jgi:predicted lipid-binding transport protein (Tim44 family)
MTTIVFALLAIFVVWKLRSVLGQRTGAERPPQPPETMSRARERARFDDPDRWKPFAVVGGPVADGLDAIARRDPSFDARAFVEGAKQAYEMIVTAFAKGDRRTLQPLLAREVYDSFAAAITEREKRGEKAETTFVAIPDVKIERAAVNGSAADLTLRIHAQFISAVRDSAGAVVDGSPDTVADVSDLWTFSRDVTSRDPNWKLVSTQTGA